MRNKDITFLQKQKTVKWADFKKKGGVIRGDYKVKFLNGDYYLVKYYSPYKSTGGTKTEVKKKAGRTEPCYLCGSILYSLFVVPFDMKMTPGYYCRKCRKKNDLMDIKRARRYGKIY